MATTLKSKNPHLDVTIIHSRELLLGSEPLPNRFKHKVQELVAQQGVNLVLGQRVVSPMSRANDESEVPDHQLTLSNGGILSYDMVLDTRGFIRTTEPGGANNLLSKSSSIAVRSTWVSWYLRP